MSLRQSIHALIDRLAAAGSLLCAVHCAALPLVLILAPALALGVLWSDWLERVTVISVSVIGLLSLGWGWWKHRSPGPLMLLLPGLAAMWAAVLVPVIHHAQIPHAAGMALGGVLVSLAHLFNLRLGRAHVHGPSCQHASGAC